MNFNYYSTIYILAGNYILKQTQEKLLHLAKFPLKKVFHLGIAYFPHVATAPTVNVNFFWAVLQKHSAHLCLLRYT